MSAGSELKRRRMAVPLSQQALAERLGVSVAIVSKWERDQHVPRRDLAHQLDQELEADGALVAAFGFTQLGDDPLAALREQVEQLLAATTALGERVKAQGVELARLSRQSRQSAREAAGGQT